MIVRIPPDDVELTAQQRNNLNVLRLQIEDGARTEFPDDLTAAYWQRDKRMQFARYIRDRLIAEEQSG